MNNPLFYNNKLKCSYRGCQVGHAISKNLDTELIQFAMRKWWYANHSIIPWSITKDLRKSGVVRI